MHTFGPVPSRRLGHSLGVDTLPLKTCTYDCVYCQLGRTSCKTVERKAYVEVEPVVEEVKAVLAGVREVDYVTFSGSGEPTLDRCLGAMIRQVKAITSIPVAVLTNGSLLHLEPVRRDLQDADLVIPSVDAVSEGVFRRVNRPHPELKLETILSGLKAFRDGFFGQVWLEIMLVRGVNDAEDEVQRMVHLVDEVRPDRVQLNTVVRPPAEADALPLEPERMEAIAALFGDRAQIIAPFRKELLLADQRDAKERILGMIRRRPCTLQDISLALQLHPNEVLKLVAALEHEDKIRETLFRQLRYYEPTRV